MAKKSRWSRYQPPAEMRDETGQPVEDEAPTPAKRKPTGARPKGSPTPKANAGQAAKPKQGSWVGAIVTLVVIFGAIGLAAVLANNNDDYDFEPVETTILKEKFVTDSLAQAEKAFGKQVVSVSLSEYDMKVEYFDPNARETRYVESRDYTDGYTVRVEESYYDDYLPRPFDITVLSADKMIAAVKQAIAAADDPYTFDLRISADRETGEVSMVASADGRGDDPVEITSKP